MASPAPVSIRPVPAPAPATARPAAAPPPRLMPTRGDEQLGPFYSKPGSFPMGKTDFTKDMPDYTGPLHTIKGKVVSTNGTAIEGARIEAWIVMPNGQYAIDAGRGATLAQKDGRFEFTGPYPVPYEGRPSHWHLRVTTPPGTPEHVGVVSQYYPAALTGGPVELSGKATTVTLKPEREGNLTVVLEPGSSQRDRVAGPWFPRGPFDPKTGWVQPQRETPGYVIDESIRR